MNYTARQRMRFNLGLGRTGELVLQEGDVVQGSSLRDVPRSELKEYQKVETRHRQSNPGTRLVYFRAEGVIRRAIAVVEMSPTDKRPTVPVEATHE